MSSSFIGLIFGVTQQCRTCQAAIRDFQVVSHYLRSTYFHSVVQIIKLDHSILFLLLQVLNKVLEVVIFYLFSGTWKRDYRNLYVFPTTKEKEA